MTKSSSKSKSKDKKTDKSKKNSKVSNLNKVVVLFIIIFFLVCIFLYYAYENKVWPFKKSSINSESPKPSNYTAFNNFRNMNSENSKNKIPIIKISSDYRLPIEVFSGNAARSLPTTAEVRKLIHEKYIPDMVGIPKTGEPFRLPLERDIDEKLLNEIIYASIKDMYEYDDVVFIKTTEPAVLFGIVTRISGQMIN